MDNAVKSEIFSVPTKGDWYAVAYKGSIELYQPNRDGDGIDMFHSYVGLEDSDPVSVKAREALMYAVLDASEQYDCVCVDGDFFRYVNNMEWKGTFTIIGGRIVYDYEWAREMDHADVISFVTGYVLKDNEIDA